MDRRAVGAAVVIIAVIAALALPGLTGRRIVGTASRIPIPVPPAVGDCLLAPADHGRSALGYMGVKVLAAPVGPCGQASFGEVVSVTADARSFPSTMAYNDNSRPQPDACEGDAREYLGWDRGASLGADSPLAAGAQGALAAWHPVLTRSLTLIGPDLSQYLAGQRWIACAAQPQQSPYWGSIRGGAVSTAAADAFGSCRAHTGTADERALSCALPHDSEVLGWTPAGGSAPSLLSSCTVLIRAATGMTDPTAGGQLQAAVELDKFIGSQSGSGEAGSALASCVIRVKGNLLLGGGLTGIGTGPLPWR